MALFRRLFYRKPPDHLLEISERVYVFDCCLSSELLEEEDYKIYMGGIVPQLQDYHPDSSFMVFNFGEGSRWTQISDMLSQHDMTVMEYPRQYEGCPMLPLEMIHHFLRSSEGWLSLEGQQNVLLLHCERGGWPVLAFMLAALLLFRKQYSGEQKTLEMVHRQAPKELLYLLTPLNPQPSQLRYLQYISRRNLGSDWPPPLDTPLALDYIILRFLPMYGKKGCRPVIRIYGKDSSSTTFNVSSKLLFSSSNTNKHARYYTLKECELVKIDIHHRIQGDVVLECIHLGDVNEVPLFRVMFHTAFVRSNIMMLSRDEVDVMWDAKNQIPVNFRGELLFSDVDLLPSKITTAPMYSFPSPPPLPPPPPPRHGTPSPPSPRHGVPSPPPPPPPPSAPHLDMSELHSLFSAIVPEKDISKEGGRRKLTGSKTEKVHMVPFPDVDESQKFWDAFWEKVDLTFMEEKLSKFRCFCGCMEYLQSFFLLHHFSRVELRWGDDTLT